MLKSSKNQTSSIRKSNGYRALRFFGVALFVGLVAMNMTAESVLAETFVTTCGAKLERTSGDHFVLHYDSGVKADFQFTGTATGTPRFNFVGGGLPPYDIHQIIIEGGYIGKFYRGEAEPVFHEGWNGYWVQ